MKKSTITLCGLLLLVAISAAGSGSFSQHKTGSAQELDQDSSPAEILAWLDKTTLPHAQVGFSWGSSGDSEDARMRGESDAQAGAKMVFSEGFKLAHLDGCHITLRNEALTSLYFSSKDHTSDLAKLFQHNDGKAPPPRAAQLVMWLERLSATKGSVPRRFIPSPNQPKTLGRWRTKFEYRGFFARDVFSLSIVDSERGMRQIIKDLDMTFAFNDQQTAERFDVALRRAIKLCQAK